MRDGFRVDPIPPKRYWLSDKTTHGLTGQIPNRSRYELFPHPLFKPEVSAARSEKRQPRYRAAFRSSNKEGEIAQKLQIFDRGLRL